MSTPAGRSSRIRESTVFGVGSMMSIRRLCVRISKCSRESLYLCGERITQYTFFSVGSGTGPATLAPVRVTVSTIFRAELSMTSWSYALSRMRIFCPAMWPLSFAFVCRCVYPLRRAAAGPWCGPAAVCGVLLVDLGDPARADRTAALPDREPQALFHGDRLDQLDAHLGVVTRQHHLGALGQMHDAGHVRGTEVELRAVVVEERRVPPALVLGQDVDLALELGVRRGGAGLDDDLAALHLVALDAAQQQARVVAGLALIEDLVEHLHAGDHGLLGLLLDPDDLDFLAD